MGKEPQADRLGLVELGCWATLVVFAHLTLTMDPDLGTVEPEEAYNATQAVLGGWIGPVSAAVVQYKEFCNGCTVNAWLGQGLFWILGEHLLVWKLVPLVPTLVLVASLGLWSPPRVARGIVVALVCSPPVHHELGLRAYGNHFEAGALALTCVVMASWGRWKWLPSLTAFVACFASWIALSAAWVLVALPLTWSMRGEREQLVRFVVPAMVLALAWFSGPALEVLETLRVYSEALPEALGGAQGAAAHPRATAWASALSSFVTEGAQSGWLCLAAALSALWFCWNSRNDPFNGMILTSFAVLAVVYMLSPLQVPNDADSALTARYAVPMVYVWIGAVGSAIGNTGTGTWSRLSALFLALAWAAPGTYSRSVRLTGAGVEHLFQQDFLPWFQVRRTMLTRVGPSAVWVCGREPRCQYHRGFWRGRQVGSTQCAATAACADCGEEETAGWKVGMAAGLASCATGSDPCTRWLDLKDRLEHATADARLAAACGVGDPLERFSCAEEPILEGVIAACGPEYIRILDGSHPVPAEAYEAAASIAQFQMDTRMSDPSVASWRSPSLRLHWTE